MVCLLYVVCGITQKLNSRKYLAQQHDILGFRHEVICFRRLESVKVGMWLGCGSSVRILHSLRCRTLILGGARTKITTY